MARKTQNAPKSAKNPQPKRAIDDTFVAPKSRKKKADKTFAEVLAEQAAEEGKTPEEVVEELTAPTEEAKPTRPAGTSNLANTIRAHRHNYTVALHPNGKKTQNNGDIVAQALLLVPLDELKALSGMWFEGRRYDHLNPGHARMCIGNLMRGLYNKGDARMVEWLEKVTKKAAEEVAA